MARQDKGDAMGAQDQKGQKTLTDDDIATIRYPRGPAGGGHDVDSDAHAHTDSDAAPAHSTDSDTSHPAPAHDRDAG
ncbi:hypothetical protein GCM10023209_07660 [Roseibacterium beibuensis]|uniref:Uncharacterized protein n=2 Tax=[Roseibacterium] beibuensis TaxID=1193142 RepID=A0ABP9L073_9RHOB